MFTMRGRYFKYTGKLAEEIIGDYKAGMPVKEIKSKYKISFGGLYGLIHRTEGRPQKNEMV